MLRAASDAAAAPAFYRLLLGCELIVLGSKSERLAIDIVKHGTGFYHPIFTSPERLKTFAADDLPNFSILGRTLFETTSGGQFIINPRSSLAKILYPDEIAWCLENFRPIKFAVLTPEHYPTQLVKALCVLFINRRQLQTARLAFVSDTQNESRAHIVIGIEASGDIAHLAEEIFAAAAVTNPDCAVDVASLDTKQAMHPLHQHLMSIAPFFDRERLSA